MGERATERMIKDRHELQKERPGWERDKDRKRDRGEKKVREREAERVERERKIWKETGVGERKIDRDREGERLKERRVG